MERRLWKELRRNRLAGFGFRRQQPIGPYVVDFYCSAARLIVEVDGPHHDLPGRPERDEARTRWLHDRGYRVIRFSSAQVQDDLEPVLEAILEAAGLPPSLALPLEGGGDDATGLPPPAGGRAGEGGPTASKETARRLRRNSTAAERTLWKRLRGDSLEGLHFRRQHRIGPYIVDFCCRPSRLVVEIDGYVHTLPDRIARDAVRDEYLRTQGFRVCRFSDSAIWADLEGVLAAIAEAAVGTPPSPDPPPCGRRVCVVPSSRRGEGRGGGTYGLDGWPAEAAMTLSAAQIPYAELDVRTNFSFLEGASHPSELAFQAKALGLAAMGVADRNSLAGVVRAHAEAKKQGLRLLVGCRLAFEDGAELIVYPRDRAAYGRLCRILSIGKSAVTEDGEVGEGGFRPPADGPEAAQAANDEVRAKPIPKGECRLSFEDAAALGEGLVALAPAPAVIDAAFEARLARWAKTWPDKLHLAAAPLHRGDDRARLNRLEAIAERTGAPMIATGAVLYHDPARRRLQDVLTCVREGCTIDQAGLRLQANAERFLKPPAEMARLFRGHEDALARTLEVVQACSFSLDELRYEYPDEPVPAGRTAQQHLQDLTFQGARRFWPDGPPRRVLDILKKELRLIRRVRYAPYFLTVHDIVAWARAQPDPILCQGRGSAANSVVCFCLGITSVDPTNQDVLFERFISEARSEPPDIDVDFEHERREQVIQYVYRRYGRHRAAICATVICYRPRSAIRDVGKAMGLTEDVTSTLANTVWGSWGSEVADDHVDRTGLKREDPRLNQALELTRELVGFPRHLSQHVGGFVLTQGPLVETCPVGNAAMAERTFIEWDKDDIDELGIMKVDVLALGMLSAIKRAFDLIALHFGERWTLASLPREEPGVYDMLCKADSLGVFQVESRAQMAMLPRLRPREFYDLVVEVAIVRPGPIQGDMVHPYLKRRQAQREARAKGRPFEIDFPAPAPRHGDKDELRRVLGKTLGVPLFQEQAMRIAMEAAKFTGDEANGLRRAMATFRHMGTIHQYEEMMVGRMIARGYDPDFANNCFNQIKGFGEYGFPESHAAAFAQLVYVSAWIKHRHPEVFAAALLNSQPMGFYAPAQIVRDARDHGVEVRHPDVNASDWDCTLESPLPEGEEGARSAKAEWEGEGLGRRRTPSSSQPSGLGPSFSPREKEDAVRHPGVNTSDRDCALESPLPEGEEGARSAKAEWEGEGLGRRRTPSSSQPSGLGPSFSPREKEGAVHPPGRAMRLGLRQVDGFRQAWADQITAARAGGLFRSIDDLRRRAELPAKALDMLAAADALGSLELTRREGLWSARGLPRAAPAPLFAAAGIEEADGAPPAALPRAALSEEVVHDYETIRLSLKAHPVSFLRERLAGLGAVEAGAIATIADGRRVRFCGVVLVRQRPGSAEGVVFMTLEDETGIANVVVWPKVFEAFRPAVMGARMLMVDGRVQRAADSEGAVIHLVAERLEDRSADLALLSDAGPPVRPPVATDAAKTSSGETRMRASRRHPRNMLVLPRSRLPLVSDSEVRQRICQADANFGIDKDTSKCMI